MVAKNGRDVRWHELPSNFWIRLILFKRLWMVLILLKVSHSLWVLTHNLFQKQMKVVGKPPWWTQLLLVRHIITHVPTALGEKKAASLPMCNYISLLMYILLCFYGILEWKKPLMVSEPRGSSLLMVISMSTFSFNDPSYIIPSGATSCVQLYSRNRWFPNGKHLLDFWPTSNHLPFPFITFARKYLF